MLTSFNSHLPLCSIVTSFCEEGDLFHRIRNRAKSKEYFSESEVMDMFVQVHTKQIVKISGGHIGTDK